MRHAFQSTCHPAATLLLLAAVAPADAQNDLSVSALLQPESGCALTAAEDVTVRVLNLGASLPAASTFNVAYSINAGAPINELVVLDSSLSSSSVLDVTFATVADLSLPGSYDFDAGVFLPGDVNPANDALDGLPVVSLAASVGGVLSGPFAATTSGILTLVGQTGDIVEWQQSVDGLRWRSLENTTASQPFSNLAGATFFRVEVRTSCASAYSNTFVVRTTESIFSDGFEP